MIGVSEMDMLFLALSSDLVNYVVSDFLIHLEYTCIEAL